MKQNLISEVLVSLRAKVWIEIKLMLSLGIKELGIVNVGVRLHKMNESGCNILIRISAQTSLCL